VWCVVAVQVQCTGGLLFIVNLGRYIVYYYSI